MTSLLYVPIQWTSASLQGCQHGFVHVIEMMANQKTSPICNYLFSFDKTRVTHWSVYQRSITLLQYMSRKKPSTA